MSAGIDYGMGRTNINHATGIRFGVISQNDILQAWADSSEGYYGEPTCPRCGRQADKPEEFGESFADGRPNDYTDEPYETDDFVCVECKHFFGSESAFGDEALGFTYAEDGYKAESCLDSDVMILESPFYTYAPFCSPCVPGAGNLNAIQTTRIDAKSGVKTYCFGHDWFEDGKAPYRVFNVADDTEVMP